jgi:hypothetical protein
LTSGATFLFGAIYFAGVLGPPSAGVSPAPIGIGLMVTSAVAALVAANPFRTRIARLLSLDPDNPVHALALALAVILFGSQVTLVSFTNVLAADQAQPPLTVVDLFAQELPFLIIAVTGVGLFIRRNGTETAVRLGVVTPMWWQITLALSAAGIFFAFAQGVDTLSHAWTPGMAHQIDTTTQHVFGGLIHTQYSVSFDTLAVFILALGLGVIRKYTNTTTSSICHATYNLTVSIGIGSQFLGFAIAAELALLLLTGYALWSIRRRLAATANPAGGGS